MDDVRTRPRPAATILFVCLHGSAKSLIAAEYLNRLAEARGLALRGESVGVEPDIEVPAAIVAGLAADGIDVRGYAPCQLDADRLAGAAYVISFGCDLAAMAPALASIEQWNDLPMVSDGFMAARDAIVARVEAWLGKRAENTDSALPNTESELTRTRP